MLAQRGMGTNEKSSDRFGGAPRVHGGLRRHGEFQQYPGKLVECHAIGQGHAVWRRHEQSSGLLGGNNPSNHNPNGDSGYTFQSPSGQPIVATVPPSPSPDFILGTFQHLNNPIPAGSSITGIDLTVSTDVKIEGVDEGILSFQFHFTHNETDNGANPCADGGQNGHGVNVNGCADHVTVNALSDTAQFTIGGDHYTIDIIGFEQNGVITNGFWTEEGVTNTADLAAHVSLFSDVVTIPGAPEPSTWAMGLMGFAGLGFLGFRRSRRPVAAPV